MHKCFLVIEGLVILSVLQVCPINADSPCVKGEASTLTASVGGYVVLPCQLIPSASAVGMKVLWTRKGSSSPVHFYTEERDKTHSQHEDYRDRTHLFKEELNKGNVSLKLSKIRVSDEASYECLVTSTPHSDTSVELKVMAVGSTPEISLDDDTRYGFKVSCVSRGWYPKPDLQWTDGRGAVLTAESETREEQDREGLYTVRSYLRTPEPEGGQVSCVIKYGKDQGELRLSAKIIGSSIPYLPGYVVSFTLFLAGLISLLCLLGISWIRR
ncbi:butyrophilin subfamily 1 member A1-like [Acipenser oxyrinchus oxyrinchus]|uniref:Butyrophilin subfamily 1 member A1-like n=1 Tax=Acipenser oxyrinchus oxyrinchus TaxID=40147 RepID=A0AAD8D0L2_ACIOX|nr:butyrophilin subfamily 1 member A1-like [Acipenser oxyrinchus oxyrinchus]